MKRLQAIVLAAACAGCAQAPLPISPPAMQLASSFKEPASNARPEDAPAPVLEMAWWTMFQDPDLDALERRLLADSPDLGSALARYQQARAATDSLRAAQSPTLGASASFQRDGARSGRPERTIAQQAELNSAVLGLDLAYEVDLWGRVREQVRAGVAQERAAQADLAAARLALQAQLADNVIALRGIDAELLLLRESDAAYTRASELIDSRHALGVASGLDAERARVQLQSARSQLRQLEAQRAILEHAVAALVGADPSAFRFEARAVATGLPAVPAGVPSALLQRRPDIVAEQHRVTAAAAGVGVARTAFFPSLTIGSSAGLRSSELSRLVSLPNLFWSIGSALAVDIVDGGRRRAGVAQAQAVLEESGQRYRATVLGAVQQVEDQLALLARFGEAAGNEREAAAAAGRAVQLATRRYEQGAATYLDVVTAQTAGLEAQRSALDLETRQRRAAVQLVRALGGGWSPEAEERRTAGSSGEAVAEG